MSNIHGRIKEMHLKLKQEESVGEVKESYNLDKVTTDEILKLVKELIIELENGFYFIVERKTIRSLVVWM